VGDSLHRWRPASARGVLLAASFAAALELVSGQAQLDPKLLAHLKHLFPAATTFGPKGGDPPHIKVYAGNPGSGSETVVGFAFLTTELEPLERGYEGPIKMLVGMDTKGILAGVVVLDHHEPYGYFSIEPPQFAAQFAGKNIRDPFRVGGDVDAVSRASISVGSATRAIKNSARRAARQLLSPQAAK
jgi:NosR/NirI family nitrous oxide reductase transcriptional regulator